MASLVCEGPPDPEAKTPTEAATKAGVTENVSDVIDLYHCTRRAATPTAVWTVSPDLLVVAFATLNEVAQCPAVTSTTALASSSCTLSP